MSHQDRVFWSTFGLVIGILVIVALVFGVIANVVSDKSGGGTSRQAVSERIRPVGEVRVAGQTAAAASSPAPAPVAEPVAAAAAQMAVNAGAPAEESSAPAPAAAGQGKEIYDTACFACHGTGAAGAPKLGDHAAWTPRLAQGLDTLVEHAVKGFKAMPPKGGRMSLSDEEIRVAVDYMVSESK